MTNSAKSIKNVNIFLLKKNFITYIMERNIFLNDKEIK